jgi:putative membrane protein
MAGAGPPEELAAADFGPVTEPQTPNAGDPAIRDHLANERTFLAWVRTAVTFIGLGFAVDRLLATDSAGQLVGLALVFVGGGLMGPALLSYRRTMRAISAGGYAPPVLTSTLLTAVVMLGAFALISYILLRGL